TTHHIYLGTTTTTTTTIDKTLSHTLFTFVLRSI
ncbi:unnamed protein product, partial [Rotaria sordida]